MPRDANEPADTASLKNPIMYQDFRSTIFGP